MDIRKSEWMEVGDVVAYDFRKGPLYIVTEVKPEKGVQLKLINNIEGYEVFIFLSDAEATEWFRITNVPGEFNTNKNE